MEKKLMSDNDKALGLLNEASGKMKDAYNTLGEAARILINAVPHEMTARELLLTEARMIYADEYAYAEYSRLIWNLKLDDAAAYAERWAAEHPEKRSEK